MPAPKCEFFAPTAKKPLCAIGVFLEVHDNDSPILLGDDTSCPHRIDAGSSQRIRFRRKSLAPIGERPARRLGPALDADRQPGAAPRWRSLREVCPLIQMRPARNLELALAGP
jgi:hypothetical protein